MCPSQDYLVDNLLHACEKAEQCKNQLLLLRNELDNIDTRIKRAKENKNQRRLQTSYSLQKSCMVRIHDMYVEYYLLNRIEIIKIKTELLNVYNVRVNVYNVRV